MMPAGLPPPRPDQAYAPSGSPMAPGSPSTVRARRVIVEGADGGVFIFDGSGILLISEAGAPGTISGQTYLEGLTVYVTISGQRFALQVGQETVSGSPASAFFIHNMTNPPFADPAYSANLASPAGTAAEIVSGAATAGSAESAIALSDSTLSGTAGGEIDMAAGLVTVSNNLQVAGNINAQFSTITITGGNVNLNMASPVNFPTAGKTLAQTQACLDALITSMKNRQLVAP